MLWRKLSGKPKTGRKFCQAWFWGILELRIYKDSLKLNIERKIALENLDKHFGGYFIQENRGMGSYQLQTCSIYYQALNQETGNKYPYPSSILARSKETVKNMYWRGCEANRMLYIPVWNEITMDTLERILANHLAYDYQTT